MSRTAWQENVAQTQLILQQGPDRCFVCAEVVPEGCGDCLIEAFLDRDHQRRIAVVCGRARCRATLADSATSAWQRLFDALTHWPDRAIYPLGPHWAIRRPHHLTFRTDPRRTHPVG